MPIHDWKRVNAGTCHAFHLGWIAEIQNALNDGRLPGPTKHAYIEPTAINHALIDMLLFVTPDRYIPVPLEETYLAAYRGVPRRWRVVLEHE